MQANSDKLNLLGAPQASLETFFAEIGEKPFRARQIMQWVHQRHADDFETMTDLSKKMRASLPGLARPAKRLKPCLFPRPAAALCASHRK